VVDRVIILGSGAAPGVPSLACGYGRCNGKNRKNKRLRVGTYYKFHGAKFLVDTSPDLRTQLLKARVDQLDAVFYTHTHADHLHGIDDLREINRLSGKAIELFASPHNLEVIKQRFGYLIAEDAEHIEPIYRAALHPNTFTYGESFDFMGIKVTPIELLGHNVECNGYIFNDGEVVHIADFRVIPEEALKLIKRQPKLLIMPLTTPNGARYHASFKDLVAYQEKIKATRVLVNHMAVECDYDKVRRAFLEAGHPEMLPAYDGLQMEI
jgi:phosphoribosyl 1,2-cyclic phosphate phosphodiesterase